MHRRTDRQDENTNMFHTFNSSIGFHIKTCKFKYKTAIADAYVQFDGKHDNAIYRHFLNKKPNEFWKALHAKFVKKINPAINLPSCKTEKDIVDQFAVHFQKVYYTSATDEEAVYAYNDIRSTVACDKNDFFVINVETIDKCIKRLHTGKASGPDDLAAEHLLHAHTSLIVHLKLLFSCMLSHR